MVQGPGMSSGTRKHRSRAIQIRVVDSVEDTLPLLPSQGKPLQKESVDLHSQLGIDIATLLDQTTCRTDLVEVFCSPDSMLARTAQLSGLTAE